MGATLPAIARWVETTPEGVSWLGFFYGGNIAGAVLGSLLAGFYLLRVFDITIATFAAVAINVVVAVLGLILAGWTPYKPVTLEETPTRVKKAEAGDRSLADLRHHRAFRLCRPVFGSDLDEAAVVAVRRDGLHLLSRSWRPSSLAWESAAASVRPSPETRSGRGSPWVGAR